MAKKGVRRSIATEFKRGEHRSPSTEFFAGMIPWNAGTEKYKEFVCEHCKKASRRPASRSGSFRFCFQACAYAERGGDKHNQWKPMEERQLSTQGYIMGEKKKLRHREVVEDALGRELRKDELVHHINGNKKDNRNSNLMVCSNSFHRWLHNHMSLLYQQEHFDPAPVNSGG